MNKTFFVAFHKPTQKYLRFNEIYEAYEPMLNAESIDVTNASSTPDYFNTPSFKFCSSRLGMSCKDMSDYHAPLNDADIEFHTLDITVTLTITPIK